MCPFTPKASWHSTTPPPRSPSGAATPRAIGPSTVDTVSVATMRRSPLLGPASGGIPPAGYTGSGMGRPGPCSARSPTIPPMTDPSAARDDAGDLRRLVGDELRAVIDDLLCHQTPAEGLRQSLALLADVRRALDGPPAPAYNAVTGYWTGAAESWGSYLDMTMFGGRVNPLGTPMRLDYGVGEDGNPFAAGTVRLGRAYLGGPNMVHGGYVAGLLDHMF